MECVVAMGPKMSAFLVTFYHLSTEPMELEQNNQSDALIGYLYLSVTPIVQAWAP